MSDENARPILESKDALGSGNIAFKRRLRLLNDADVVTILDKNVVNAPPAGAIRPGTVNQNNIPDAMFFIVVLR